MASKSDHPSFLFKLLPPWLRVLTREFDCYKNTEKVFAEGSVLRKEQVATKRSLLAQILFDSTKVVHTHPRDL